MRICTIFLIIVCCGIVDAAAAAEDAYIKADGNRWTLGTAVMEQVIVLEDGRLVLKSLTNKTTGHEFIASGAPSEEFFASIGDSKEHITSAGGPWKLIRSRQTKLKQGELQLDLVLQRNSLSVTKSYVVYPGSSIVRQWVTFSNAGDRPLGIAEPGFLSETVRPGDPDKLDFHWMTGAESQPGSWGLRTEKLSASKPRTFDSYDPFPSTPAHAGEKYGFRMGSMSYAPWYALLAADTQDGVVVGWDYFGHWKSSLQRDSSGAVTVRLCVAGHKQTLAPGESLTTPKAFVGLFRGDLDEAGNEVLDWQYRYLWDYTRDGWFPAIRVLGCWYKGTGWQQPGTSWTTCRADWESLRRKVFRVADLMRSIGGDVYHRDWGWWDRAGDWNGPDFRATGDYLRKSGMGQLIYAFLYTVDEQSKVAKEHPDWLIRKDYITLDMSKPEVVAFMKRQLDDFHDRWGDFEWRNDSVPTAARNGDDTPLLGQDAGLRQVIQSFLDKYPGCAFQAVNGGGNNAGYDYTRYASSTSFSDGGVGLLRNYYASLMLPPDKSSDIPDAWNPGLYDKATWRGLLCTNFDMTGDVWDMAKIEGLRELIDIYHYLHKQGVVGRWVRVYRPSIVGDDPTMYFQRLSRDRRRGIIIPKRQAKTAVTIKPKGLLPTQVYVVNFQESKAIASRTGKDLMDHGITIDAMPPGELVYLNLPLHPGSNLDTELPTAPTNLQAQAAENLGYPGVELTWKPGTDNNWISYYEVFRNGEAIDRVAKGTYYFDHSVGADLAAKYEVRTVDGAGNASAKAAVAGSKAAPARIIDGAPNAAIVYTGDWLHLTQLFLAHAGTSTCSKQEGATCSLTFEGKRVLWFSALGPSSGKAEVRVDSSPAEVVDIYSADEIWDVCVYRKEFPNAGRHTLKITVLGKHGPLATDSIINVDGFRVE